ncbi:MAG: ribosome-associated translation inhibitor RaiA [Rectinemataceae bacterium]|nr:ribosome-associated translation inhibitor RaiA [Rectinemataceae bacterium]
MKIDVRSVHFDLGETSSAYLNSKLERIEYARDMIVDLIFIFTKDAKNYKIEANVNFRWGIRAHVEEESFDITSGIDKLIDKLEQKITKEKEKVQEKK